MINRLTYDAASVTHLDAFRWATEGSAHRLGRTDIGIIAPGKQADMAFYKLDEVRFRAPATHWRRWCCAAPMPQTG